MLVLVRDVLNCFFTQCLARHLPKADLLATEKLLALKLVPQTEFILAMMNLLRRRIQLDQEWQWCLYSSF